MQLQMIVEKSIIRDEETLKTTKDERIKELNRKVIKNKKELLKRLVDGINKEL